MTTLAFPDTTGQPTDGSFTYEANGVLYSWTGEYWAANNAQGFDQRYVNADGDVMSGDLTVPSLNEGPLAGLRNQLLNPNFSVAQRGASFTNPINGYTYDRWFASGNLSVNGATNTPEIGLTAVELTGGGFFGQGIELVSLGYPFINGSQWTISFLATEAPTKVYANFRDNVGSTGNQVVVAEISAFTEVTSQAPTNTAYKKYSATFTVGVSAVGSNKCLEITFEIPNATYRLTSVQLEQGPVATPLEIRPVGLELSLCQRYFERKNIVGHVMVKTGLNSEFRGTYFYKVEKRVNPTVDRVPNVGSLKVQPGGTPVTNLTFQWHGHNQVAVLANGNTSWNSASFEDTVLVDISSEL